MKPQPVEVIDGDIGWPCNAVRSCLMITGRYADQPDVLAHHCPHGKPGDRLWVRETFLIRWLDEEDDTPVYRSTFQPDDLPYEPKWTPSIHMPRWASRITLEVTGIKVERVQAITAEECLAEGMPPLGALESIQEYPKGSALPRYFAKLWDGIYAKRPGLSWHDNPWVWAVSFRRVEGS